MNTISEVRLQSVLSAKSGSTIVAVTKSFPFTAVESAYTAGFRHMGENRVVEAKAKIEQARGKDMHDIVWHMIGHVQSRKASEVAQLFDWVDSVDSVEVAQKLNKKALEIKKTLHILVEVNVSGEEGKFGIDVNNWSKDKHKLDECIKKIRDMMVLPNLIVEGLMTMPPYVKNAQDNRSIFRSMKELSRVIRDEIFEFGAELSMGTSCDYVVAIEEGATQVRLGEALFGPRE